MNAHRSLNGSRAAGDKPHLSLVPPLRNAATRRAARIDYGMPEQPPFSCARAEREPIFNPEDRATRWGWCILLGIVGAAIIVAGYALHTLWVAAPHIAQAVRP